jgi:ABC-type multidrug transport system fused ATPase/permease subunit
VFFSVILVVTVLGNIASPLMIISKAISAAVPFFSIIDARQPPTTGITELDTASPADITFNYVSFAYPSRSTTQVLRGFHARFEQGKTTALVGPSGSGKSTIVALLERWYDLQASDDVSRDSNIVDGGIQVGGVNINKLDLGWWRSQIGLVQQEPVLFDTTIMENISMGLSETKWEHAPEAIKRDMVLKASEEAFVDDFVQTLPQVCIKIYIYIPADNPAPVF